jgi:hypothetical protein
MKTKLLLILFTIVVLASCKKALIKPDPENPDLPLYSERGLNVGGILINDKAWLTVKLGLFSTTRPLQLLSYPNGDSIVVLLNGNFKDSSLQNQNLRTIFVVIKNIKIISDDDLLQLNGKSYILDGNTNYGGFSSNYGQDKVGKAVGNITFGKVSVINNITYGDGSPNNPILHPYIVAGQLNMNFFTTTNFSLTKGRFDVTLLRSTNQFIVF